MNFTYFVKLLLKRWMFLFLLPIIASAAIYFMTKKAPKVYQSTMTLYTGLTSGVTIDAQTSNVDYSQALIAYDNLLNVMKSERTLSDLGLRLFCRAAMSDGKDKKIISAEYFSYLQKSIPPEVKKLIDKKSEETTYQKCKEFMDKNDDNFIYNLVRKSGTNFSVGSLSSIEVKRLNTSDLVNVSYQANDPGICYQTLLLLFEETRQNFQALKSGQSVEVLKYFESQKTEVKSVLDKQEQELLDFSKQNKIMNYDEQSKLIVSQKFGVEDRMDVLNMALEGAAKSIEELEKKLGIQNKLRLKSDQIVNIRNQIAKLSSEHAARSFYSADTASVSQAYEKRLNMLRGDFRQAVDSLHLINNTNEGVTVESILSQWLNNVIAYDQAKAQIPIIEKRTKMINDMFDQYSPLGADVKRQEREIGVSEQQYLSILSGLHAARLKDQSSKMSAGSISVLDEPNYPTSYIPEKSSLRAIVAFLAVFLLVLVLIIVIEFIDKTVSNVARAERFSLLKVGFLFPLISTKKKNKRLADLDEVASNYLALELLRVLRVKTDPVQVNLISIYSQEGKSFIKEKLEAAFQKIDEKSETDFVELIQIKEFPALSDQYYDVNAAISGDITILVCRANRGWKAVDSRVVELFTEQTGKTPILLLNGVVLGVLESQWANVPIKRSKLSLFANKLLSMELTAKGKF